MQRPLFAAAWAAAQRIYEPSNPGAKVARLIGGMVARNIGGGDPTQQWSNTCVVRLSYILNQGGVSIPAIPRQTVTGADHRQYFFRLRNLHAFLTQRWGRPDQVVHSPSGSGRLASSRGVVLFSISGWSDAQGHASLFNGTACYDQCYFNTANVSYHNDQVSMWRLS